MAISHPQIKELEYDHVADGIYVGTNQCCQAHFDERLRREGITADISLEGERIDQPFGVEFYLWLPVKDKTAPSQEQLRLGAGVLEQLVSMGKKVYVHCMNGHSRAPTLVAAYLIAQGASVEKAIATISEKRLVTHLEDVQRAALEEFRATLHRGSCCCS